MYIWEAHPNEIIWDVKHHSVEPLLLTAGADDLIQLWRTPSLNEINTILDQENENSKLEDKIFQKSFQLSGDSSNQIETPTCINWLNINSTNFFACYNSGQAAVFDINKETQVYSFDYLENTNVDCSLSQINSMCIHPHMNVAITVTEDSSI
jgi:WD40 repeat protein